MSITALISTIATLALLLLLGYGGGKLKYIDETATERLSTLIVKIGQPFLIINGLISQEFSKENLTTGLKILVLGLCMHAFMACVAYLCARPVKPFDERKLSEFSMFFANQLCAAFSEIRDNLSHIFFRRPTSLSFHRF